MTNIHQPQFTPSEGYLTRQIQKKYIDHAVEAALLPQAAHRIASVVSLTASRQATTPIQFWQLYSVLGPQRINNIVTRFYNRVYADEAWFASVFSRISGKEHHIQTQSAMWLDVMGGGMRYHGGEYRLNFHHTHNAFELMNAKGARRWTELMVTTLNDPVTALTDDPRVRPATNTFLDFFMRKYAEEFGFDTALLFGDTNPPLKRRINFLKMSSDEVETLSEEDLTEALRDRGVDVSALGDKEALVNKALSL
jgi:truncated hemoglobin YjbI